MGVIFGTSTFFIEAILIIAHNLTFGSVIGQTCLTCPNYMGICSQVNDCNQAIGVRVIKVSLYSHFSSFKWVINMEAMSISLGPSLFVVGLNLIYNKNT